MPDLARDVVDIHIIESRRAMRPLGHRTEDKSRNRERVSRFEDKRESVKIVSENFDKITGTPSRFSF